jgi:hypothetical protein
MEMGDRLLAGGHHRFGQALIGGIPGRDPSQLPDRRSVRRNKRLTLLSTHDVHEAEG